MKVSINWLKEFTEVPPDPRELKLSLTRVGLNVESFSAINEDHILDIEVTTNRPDCLSHYGVAREIATIYHKPLKRLEHVVKDAPTAASSQADIEIAAPDLCARYCGRVIRGLQVKPSPPWLSNRLHAVGLRSINNVADATNYVLMELGHPLHAFDLRRLRQHRIVVRRARASEILKTLDGMERRLTADNLVIADGERPVALAGVMGGQDSEIASTTEDVLLESAWFDPTSIRRTSKAQGLHTEASHRFERGADVEMCRLAIDRTALLIAELSGGEILRGVIDVYPQHKPREALALRRSEILRILGVEISWEEVERVLRALGFHTERRGTEGWRVAPPTYRLDVAREVDLIEEVARHYGYDRLPARVRPAPPRAERDWQREKELTISNQLVGLGYREIITSSMVDPAENARFTDHPPVMLANPLSQEASALRSTSVPSMLHALRWNMDRDQHDLRLFEIGKTYTLRAPAEPEERRSLTLGASANRHPENVHEAPAQIGFFDVKGDIQTVLNRFDIGAFSFEAGASSYLEAGLCGRVLDAEGNELAILGRLSREIEVEYKFRQAIWLAEINLDSLLQHPLKKAQFRTFSKFPSVKRDFSLIVPNRTSYREVARAFRVPARDLIEDIRPIDFYQGQSVPAGHYALLVRVSFCDRSQTLTKEQVDRISQQVLIELHPLGVTLRQ